jgi:dihydrofolate reductase
MSKQREIILVAARARNGVIGRDNGLPWRLKADLAHFKRVTMGHPIVMGRKTWESLGRALPGRRNLVVTRNPAYSAEGAEVFTTPQAAIEAANDDAVYVIGGAELYRQLLATADRPTSKETPVSPNSTARSSSKSRARRTPQTPTTNTISLSSNTVDAEAPGHQRRRPGHDRAVCVWARHAYFTQST